MCIHVWPVGWGGGYSFYEKSHTLGLAHFILYNLHFHSKYTLSCIYVKYKSQITFSVIQIQINQCIHLLIWKIREI